MEHQVETNGKQVAVKPIKLTRPRSLRKAVRDGRLKAVTV
jgi:hypothetical protein